MLDFEGFSCYRMHTVPQPALPHLFVGFCATPGGITEQVAASNDLQTAVNFSLESIEITECQKGIGLNIVLGRGGYTAAVVPVPYFMTVPRTSTVSSPPGQKLVMIEEDVFTAKTHALEFQHVRVREDVHNKWNVAGIEVFGKHTVLSLIHI